MLKKLLDGVTVTKMFYQAYGQQIIMDDLNIHHIQYDSRMVKENDLFVAIRGTNTDGHNFITDAINNGASAVMLEDDLNPPDSYFLHTGVAKLVVPNTREALAKVAANFYNHPSTKLTLIGITGTNGKTTTAHLIKSILELNGIKTGMIGTIEYSLGNSTIPASNTTPESLELNQYLTQMINSGCTHAVMEVSSHALHQHRVTGLDFNVGVFTNLTQDHLDYHGSIENYFLAKRILFEKLGQTSFAVVNIDDEWGQKFLTATKARTITYGTTANASLRASDIHLSLNGIYFTVTYNHCRLDITSQLLGRFNVSNILAAMGACIAIGIPISQIREVMPKIRAARGRFAQISSPSGWTAIIDYAHTPDALEKVLNAIHDLFNAPDRGKIITVFGCGGNRDKSKRPLMAAIATALSDIVIITSDNPRYEDPNSIIDEIMTGVRKGSHVYREIDRKNAIIKALSIAQHGDVVLIAGKGHEDYQIIGNKKSHFNDMEIVEEFLQKQI